MAFENPIFAEYSELFRNRYALLLWRSLWSLFFYYVKSQNVKRYPFANVIFFLHLMWICFCHLVGVNSIKTDLQTCKLKTGCSMRYKSENQFWLNFQNQNGKNKPKTNVKKFHICKWISFHISTFHIAEEMPSG